MGSGRERVACILLINYIEDIDSISEGNFLIIPGISAHYFPGNTKANIRNAISIRCSNVTRPTKLNQGGVGQQALMDF